jgi:hypothetical protein
VWTAVDPDHDRVVAVKRARRMGGTTAALLEAEAAVLTSLPPGRCVLPLAVVGRRRHHHRLLVTEWVPGGTLAELVAAREGQGLSAASVTGLLVDLTRALGAVHGAGWVHGRVTADHVLVGHDRRAVLAGFGGARRLPGGSRTACGDDLAQLAALARGVLGPPPPDGLVAVLDRLDHPDPDRRPDADTALELLARFAPVPAPLPGPGGAGTDGAGAGGDGAGGDGAGADTGRTGGGAGGESVDTIPLPRRPGPRRHPTPPATPPRGRPRDRRGRGHAGPVLAAGIGLALVGVGVHRLATAEPVDPTPPAAAPALPCPDVGHPEPGPDETTVQADPDGRGCTVPVHWSADRAELTVATPEGVRRYRIGDPGDRVVLGDWDCDGRDTPLVVRPGAPSAFRFDDWPGAGVPVDAVPTAEPEPSPPACPEAP